MEITRQQALQWRQALAAGNYNHGVGAMYRTGCHCALGVLADLHSIKLVDEFANIGSNPQAWDFARDMLGNEMQDIWKLNDDGPGNMGLGTDYSRVIKHLDQVWDFTSEELAG